MFEEEKVQIKIIEDAVKELVHLGYENEVYFVTKKDQITKSGHEYAIEININLHKKC